MALRIQDLGWNFYMFLNYVRVCGVLNVKNIPINTHEKVFTVTLLENVDSHF
jgi:hypothetical protein